MNYDKASDQLMVRCNVIDFCALEEVGTDALGSVRQQETELTNGKNQSRDSDLVCTLNMFPGFRLPVHSNPWRWFPSSSLIS